MMAHTPQLPLDLRVTRAALFDNYRAAEGDPVIALIRAHASGYPETEGAHVSGRPAAAETVVFLWGTTGSGKTHLLESAVALAQSRGRNARFVSASAGNTLYTGTDADADLVCLDDVDRIAGDAEAERAVFALFEEQRAAGAQLLVSARRPPSDIAFDLLDLQSRLMWGPVLRIDPLDDEALRNHFSAHAERFGLRLSSDVVEYVLRHCPRDAGYLEALAAALHRQSLAERRHVTVRLVGQLIAERSSG